MHKGAAEHGPTYFADERITIKVSTWKRTLFVRPHYYYYYPYYRCLDSILIIIIIISHAYIMSYVLVSPSWAHAASEASRAPAPYLRFFQPPGLSVALACVYAPGIVIKRVNLRRRTYRAERTRLPLGLSPLHVTYRQRFFRPSADLHARPSPPLRIALLPSLPTTGRTCFSFHLFIFFYTRFPGLPPLRRTPGNSALRIKII